MGRFTKKLFGGKLASIFLLAATAHASSVELHAHLFMKEGMTWAFRGDFFGPLKAETYKDVFSSQANPQTMERSELKVVVVSLYAHPLFVFSLRDSIRRQIRLTKQFVAQNPDWMIARDAKEAEQAIADNRKVLILSLEGASGILETEEDLKEFVDREGLRIVTLLHLTDDEYGGVALLKGLMSLADPFALLRQIFRPTYSEAVRANDHGLTEQGRIMAKRLIERKVWIDLAHASDASQKELIPMLKEAGQPLLYTHTALRRYHGAERGIADWQLEEVRKTGGYIGLMPSETMMKGTPLPDDWCDAGSAVQSLAVQFTEAAKVLGPDAVALGSDFNGGIDHLKPLKAGCQTRTTLDRQGFWNIGQSADLWQAIQSLGATVPEKPESSVTRFLKAWSKVTSGS